VQANSFTRAVGAPNPVFTGTITGLKNADVITASYSTTADQTSPAGTYPIIPSVDPSPALGNYAVTLINGTLTVHNWKFRAGWNSAGPRFFQDKFRTSRPTAKKYSLIRFFNPALSQL